MDNTELAHYGVKGMKWGVRRDHDDSPNARYSEKARANDKSGFGSRGVKRINRRMNSGDSYNKAMSKELGRQLATTAAISLGSTAVAMALVNPQTYVNISKVQAHVQTRAGRALADTMVREAASNTTGIGRYVGDVILSQGADGVMRLAGK